MRLSRSWLAAVVHSPKGINFTLTSEEALEKVRHKYSRRWFGARLDYLDLRPPSKEFVPFYLCRGRIQAIYTARIDYDRADGLSGSNSGGHRGGSASQSMRTAPQLMNSVFVPAQTQLYAGYKYNHHHIHRALRTESNAQAYTAMSQVHTSDATIHLFEQSTQTMRELLQREVRLQATRTAEAVVRNFHPAASSITITFDQFQIQLEDIIPVFVPCYVIKAEYDSDVYTMYVSGRTGTVSGPYLINALAVARLASLATLSAALLMWSRSAAQTLWLSASPVLVVGVYYAAYYASRWVAPFMRDRQRRQRARMRASYEAQDVDGFRPSTTSQRITDEYHRSSYWDSHTFQQRSSDGGYANWDTGSSSSSRSGYGSESSYSSYRDGSTSSSSSSQRAARNDPQGYYAALGLCGNESINEIRSAYRKEVLKEHPDVGGSTERMSKVNTAYRVLRDPARRAAYDRGEQ